MAEGVSAKFGANFRDFDAGVERAKATLQGLDGGAVKADASLKRMAAALDGDRLAKAAQDAIAAIGKIENVAGLTDQQLKKVDSALGQYVQRLQRMGETVPASLQQMNDAVKGQIGHLDTAATKTSLWGTALGSVKTVAAGMVAGFTLDRVVTGLASAVGSTVDWAGSITDLSAKVGVSTTALQRWEFAANRSGNTLDEIVGAAQELSRRLAEGEDSTVGALDRMGLSLDSLRQMSPEQQFETVAAALSKVKDQGRFTADGIDLLGKSFKSVAPTIRADLQAVGDEAERMGAIVKDETIEAMDALGDTMGDLKIIGRSLISDMLEPMVPALKAVAEASMSVGKDGSFGWLESYASATGNVPLMQLAGMWMGDRGLKRKADTNLSGGSSAWVPAYERAGYTGTVNNAQDWYIKGITEAARAQLVAANELQASAKYWRDWNAEQRNRTGYALTEVVPTYGWTPNAGGGGLTVGSNLPNPWGGVGLGPGAIPDARSSWTAQQPSAWAGWANQAMSLASPFLTGAVGNSRSAGIGSSIGSIGSSALSNVMGLAGGALTGIGTAMSVALPFVGPLVGGLLGNVIGKLFGPSAGAIAGKKADQNIASTQAGLLQQYGSLDTIAGMGSAGAELAAAWGSKNVQGEAHFNALVKAFERQNQLLNEQKSTESEIAGIEAQRTALNDSLKTTWDQVVSIAEKYGINLEGLGKQAAQLGTTSTWTSMLNDLQAIERAAGPDGIGGALAGMADEMSAMVQQALRAGTEIPENWRPYLESVALAGKLVDENGQAITDLSQIKFGPAVKTQADIVKDAMDRLDETFAKLNDNLSKILDKIAAIPGAAAAASGATIDINARVNTERVDGGGETSSGYSFAGGSAGLRDFGAGTLAMLHGREAVLTESQYRAAQSGGAGPRIVQIVLNGRVLAEELIDQIPNALQRRGLAGAF
jgi:hypothetical protein